jgi:hypothetical protein
MPPARKEKLRFRYEMVLLNAKFWAVIRPASWPG